MKKKGSGGCGCLGAPMRALSRACDSACDLYVRGMYGCVRGVKSGSSAAGIAGRGFSGSGAASSLRLRSSSDKADDLLRAAAAASCRRQRRVAAEPEPATVEAVGYGASNKMLGSAGGLVDSAAPAGRAPARKKAVAATMGTIAEDAPCEFSADGAFFSSMKPPRRAAFGDARAGSDNVFAR